MSAVYLPKPLKERITPGHRLEHIRQVLSDGSANQVVKRWAPAAFLLQPDALPYFHAHSPLKAIIPVD
jgi:hypothetical protein